jgi:serine/threonine-protein kinase
MTPAIPRHRIERPLAKTPFGQAFAASETWSGRDVVVEVGSDLGTAEARARFLRDAMIAQRLEGEHVLRVLDLGTLPDGTPYFVREPIVTSVATEVHTRGPIDTERAVSWTLSACEAIAEAHALGIVHGDVRPENVFLARRRDGELDVKVRWTSASKADDVEDTDYQRDIAGLAELLRAMLSGQVNLVDEHRAHTIPAPLSEIIANTLTARGDARPLTVEDFASELAPYAPEHEGPRNVAFMLSRAGIASGRVRSSITPMPVLAAAPGVAPDPQAEAWFDKEPRRSRLSVDVPPPSTRRRSVTFAAVAIGIVAAVAIGTILLWQGGNLPSWTGSADPAQIYGTTTLTSADIERAGTSADLAADVTTAGIEERSVPIATSMATPPIAAPKVRVIDVPTLPLSPF